MDVDSPGPCRFGRAARPSSQYKHSRGLTLVELLFTIAMAAILLGTAVPAFHELLQDVRMTSRINNLVAALHLARSEAIKRRGHILVCVSDSRGACVRNGGWEQGWVVFHDRNGNRDKEPQETALLMQEPQHSGATITFSAFGSRHQVLFSPDGFTRSSNGTFIFCDRRGAEKAKALILSKTGRLRVSRTKPDGTPLTCPAG